MRSLVVSSVAVLLLTGRLAALSAPPPSFAGQWKVVAKRTIGVESFGKAFTAKQDAKILSFEMTNNGQPDSVVYNLDGTESRHALAPGVWSVTVAAWEGDELVVVTRVPEPHAAEITRRLKLTAKDELTIKTIFAPEGKTLTTVYARSAAKK